MSVSGKSMYQLKWEKTKEGNARLLAVAETPTELILPDSIEGCSLTEIAAECFAKKKSLERAVLPDSIKLIERMAFYNCTGLKELEFGANLAALGADVFMNCHSLHHVRVRCGALEKSGIRLILQQISEDMCVHFTGGKEKEEAVILFPEYYETYDEVAPAHLFGRSITGEGFRARQCFKEGILEYERYDSIFQKACAEETAGVLCEMAMNRLRYPVGLSEDAREQYTSFLLQHMNETGQKIVRNRALSELEFLCKNGIADRGVLEDYARIAADAEWAEGGAYILRLKEMYFPKDTKENRYEFDDF